MTRRWLVVNDRGGDGARRRPGDPVVGAEHGGTFDWLKCASRDAVDGVLAYPRDRRDLTVRPVRLGEEHGYVGLAEPERVGRVRMPA